jgi:outer membrane scaffolding protein for murein synthesis (MipA/OmpV family)
LFCIGGLFLLQPAHAVHEPLWELGIGVGLLSTPDYRGSLTESNIALPFPYAIYRGSFLKIDREDGVRGKLFENATLQFELSLAGNVPVSDSDSGARSGMPSLDPLVEIGAELSFSLWRAQERDHSFSFVVPLRLVYSVGDPLLEFQGVTVSPFLNYKIRQEDHGVLMRYNASFGPIFANSRYNNYFYEVDSRFATPDRPEYHPDSGYGGSRVTLSVTRHHKRVVVGAFVRYDTLDGAVFDDSPLVETNDYFVVGFIFGWILGESSTMVPH